jgi:hypothetical protein
MRIDFMHNDVTRRDAREILVFVVTAGIQTKQNLKQIILLVLVDESGLLPLLSELSNL